MRPATNFDVIIWGCIVGAQATDNYVTGLVFIAGGIFALITSAILTSK